MTHGSKSHSGCLAHNKAVHLTTREVHCLSSILVSPPLVSLDLPESWALDTDTPSSVLFGNSLPSCLFHLVVIAIAMDWILFPLIRKP
ncbi:hypothetical protein HID58_013874 [Brassica napus]|uniref:Uncharacterized protein n=1 Tax=Brassica napus TaxID=3708 RepID=A0ABQ8DGG0_BRANA|nr:hypothetical protein HID58_013874 [Brassica napus]